MSIRIKRRWVLAISCLIISGCTEKTIIREVPVSAEPDAGVPNAGVLDSGNPLTPTIDGGSNMVTGETDTVVPDSGDSLTPATDGGSNMVPGGTDTGTGTDTESGTGQLEDPQTLGQSDQDPAGSPQLQDPISEPVNGAPGVSVDCENTVPCRWISEDSQFFVTVTNADNFGSQDRLQLNYSLSALHDTQVSVVGGGQALDDSGLQFQPGKQTLGTRPSAVTQNLIAGASLDGAIVFGQGAESKSLTDWSITILDGGIARLPSFTNIPVGTLTTDYADCDLVLPCVWMTPEGNVSITLTSAGGYTTKSRLSTTFTVQSSTSIDVALDDGAFAISSEGTKFTGRTHSLGIRQGAGKITAEAYAGQNLTGGIDYYQNSAVPTVLSEVSLVLYQNSPVPRWNPKFVNIPVQ
jgi:hypothetical protein